MDGTPDGWDRRMHGTKTHVPKQMTFYLVNFWRIYGTIFGHPTDGWDNFSSSALSSVQFCYKNALQKVVLSLFLVFSHLSVFETLVGGENGTKFDQVVKKVHNFCPYDYFISSSLLLDGWDRRMHGTKIHAPKCPIDPSSTVHTEQALKQRCSL